MVCVCFTFILLFALTIVHRHSVRPRALRHCTCAACFCVLDICVCVWVGGWVGGWVGACMRAWVHVCVCLCVCDSPRLIGLPIQFQDQALVAQYHAMASALPHLHSALTLYEHMSRSLCSGPSQNGISNPMTQLKSAHDSRTVPTSNRPSGLNPDPDPNFSQTLDCGLTSKSDMPMMWLQLMQQHLQQLLAAHYSTCMSLQQFDLGFSGPFFNCYGQYCGTEASKPPHKDPHLTLNAGCKYMPEFDPNRTPIADQTVHDVDSHAHMHMRPDPAPTRIPTCNPIHPTQPQPQPQPRPQPQPQPQPSPHCHRNPHLPPHATPIHNATANPNSGHGPGHGLNPLAESSSDPDPGLALAPTLAPNAMPALRRQADPDQDLETMPNRLSGTDGDPRAGLAGRDAGFAPSSDGLWRHERQRPSAPSESVYRPSQPVPNPMQAPSARARPQADKAPRGQDWGWRKMHYAGNPNPFLRHSDGQLRADNSDPNPNTGHDAIDPAPDGTHPAPQHSTLNRDPDPPPTLTRITSQAPAPAPAPAPVHPPRFKTTKGTRDPSTNESWSWRAGGESWENKAEEPDLSSQQGPRPTAQVTGPPGRSVNLVPMSHPKHSNPSLQQNPCTVQPTGKDDWDVPNPPSDLPPRSECARHHPESDLAPTPAATATTGPPAKPNPNPDLPVSTDTGQPPSDWSWRAVQDSWEEEADSPAPRHPEQNCVQQQHCPPVHGDPHPSDICVHAAPASKPGSDPATTTPPPNSTSNSTSTPTRTSDPTQRPNASLDSDEIVNEEAAQHLSDDDWSRRIAMESWEDEAAAEDL